MSAEQELPIGPEEEKLEAALDAEQEIVDDALRRSRSLVSDVDFYSGSWDNYTDRIGLKGTKLA